MSEIGDNSGAVNAGHLQAFIERIERVNAERAELASDVSDIYKEARGTGYDTKAMKEVVKLRAMDHDKRIEHETLVDLYRSAIGLS